MDYKILLMAKSKSKKSRRDRRIETEKRQTSSGEGAYNASSAFSSVPQTTMSVSKTNADTKTIDLGTEYYYVYTDVRNILAISLVMFGILFGLGMFI